MSTSEQPVPPRLVPDDSGKTAGITTVKIEWQCPQHGGMNTTSPIASMEVLYEWIDAGLRQHLFTEQDAEHLADEGWQMGLPENRTSFDEEMDRRRPPTVYIEVKMIIFYV